MSRNVPSRMFLNSAGASSRSTKRSTSRRLSKSVGITARACPGAPTCASAVMSVNVPSPLFRSSRLGAFAYAAGKASGLPAGVAAASASPATKRSRSPSWSMSTSAALAQRYGKAGILAAAVTSLNVPSASWWNSARAPGFSTSRSTRPSLS